MKKIIKGGKIVSTEGAYVADIYIEDETIKMIASEINPTSDEIIINAEGKFVFPGSIDVHTHLSNIGQSDNFQDGSIAAAAGGVTSLINMNDQLEEGESLISHINKWKGIAKDAVIDYSFHEVIPGERLNDKIIKELPSAVEAGCTSIKVFMAYEDKIMSDGQLYKLIREASKLGLTILVHAEEGEIINEMIDEQIKSGKVEAINHAITRPDFTEAGATKRVLDIGDYWNAKMYIVHVTCQKALEEIRKAKMKGTNVIAETCPQYLIFNEEYLKLDKKESAKYICTPPLRKEFDQKSLWKGINEGLISTVASDHCSLDLNGPKKMGEVNFSQIANGMAGIEDRFLLMYHFGVNEGRISLQTFVDLVCTSPAKNFNLQNKGTISVGKDADIVILDPNKEKVISEKIQHQTVDHNPYEGIKVNGDITHVFCRGNLLIENNTFVGEIGEGKFLNRRVNN